MVVKPIVIANVIVAKLNVNVFYEHKNWNLMILIITETFYYELVMIRVLLKTFCLSIVGRF